MASFQAMQARLLPYDILAMIPHRSCFSTIDRTLISLIVSAVQTVRHADDIYSSLTYANRSNTLSVGNINQRSSTALLCASLARLRSLTADSALCRVQSLFYRSVSTTETSNRASKSDQREILDQNMVGLSLCGPQFETLVATPRHLPCCFGVGRNTNLRSDP